MYAREHAAANPDQPVAIMATSGAQMTYREFEDGSNRVAQFFRDVGLEPKDHVAFFTENNIRLLECEGGAERTGLYFTCINSYLSPEEVA
jgi:long-chain acyl-CoA synthetase